MTGVQTCALPIYRAGEGDEVDFGRGHQLFGQLVIHVQILEQAVRQARRLETRGEAFGAERRLVRVLEDHRVAGDQRRDDRVDRGEIRIVPRRDDEDDADTSDLNDLSLREALRLANANPNANPHFWIAIANPGANPDCESNPI